MNSVDRQRLMVREALWLCTNLELLADDAHDEPRGRRARILLRKAEARWERRHKAYEAIPTWQEARQRAALGGG